jgi:hypothetical protein
VLFAWGRPQTEILLHKTPVTPDLFIEISLPNVLPGLASKYDLPNLCLPNTS